MPRGKSSALTDGEPPSYGAAMTRRKLPAGVQTFRKIREDDCYYVDKTGYIHQLVTACSHCFLSRPRRFGKSLLVDTIKELFEGNEPLFRCLAIHDRWDWTVRHPVLRFSFAGGSFKNPLDAERDFLDQLTDLEDRAGVRARAKSPARRLGGLIAALHERTGQRVVLLVDEYDRPINDALRTPEVAEAHRDFLRGVYGMVKDCDADIRFSFFTGVSKFARVSVFSDLNNLTDITLDPRFAAICGYTDDDLCTVFASELEGLPRETIRDWYNGYNWRGTEAERVYNPYGMLLLLQNREFRPYWFETGTPAFLPETLLERHVDPAALNDIVVGDADLAAFDIRHAKTEALLFQTGYLTILSERAGAAGYVYRLGYPNREVRSALNLALLTTMAPGASATVESERLEDLLAHHDFAGVERFFRAFFASVPHEWYVNNDIAHYEGYYSAVFYSHFAGAGLDVVAEESTNHGRSDVVVRHANAVWVFEFKTSGDAGDALAQIDEKGYAEKYQHLNLPIHRVGVAFSEQARNISTFEVKDAG